MRRISCVFLALLALSTMAGMAFAQTPPALLVVPSKANMLVGDSRTFRAVGEDGRKLKDVRWNVSPESAATLTTTDDEATLDATEPSATVVLTAYVGEDSSEATIEIHSGKLATGTQIWSVNNLPGCKSGQISQAVPTATGPDLYVEETCPDGRYVRAMTADGREIWRRRLGHETAPSLSSYKKFEKKDEPQTADHLNLSAHSICDEVSSGMTKGAVAKLAQDRNLPVDENQASDSWLYEENGFTCNLQFDQAGSVIKKKKTIQTD